jgi:uncharacterized RDD family membrane protein YckC
MIYDLQKAGMWKRISAYLFDFILLGMLTVGIAALLSLVLGYDNHFETMNECYSKYEEQYGVSFDIGQDDFDKFTEEERQHYMTALDALYNDAVFNLSYYMVVNLSFIIIIFSLLTSHLILEFTVPMLFKNGQTLGKKVFGVAVMRVDGVKINGPILFTRAILGKYVVETMLPILFLLMIIFNITSGIVGLIAIAAVLITNLVMIMVSKSNIAIHDLLSSTVAVDMASQLIFESPEALIEYKQRIHAQEVEKSQY